jgi:NAD dependent epimerase/dehydratase
MNVQNLKVLITGADGFIGSHLAEILVKRGAKVKALAQYNSFNNWGWLENTSCLDEIEVVCGDIRDPNFTRKITKNVDAIFHLAALIAIPYSYVAVESYVQTNIVGTLNIMQAAMENEVERIVQTSTSEVYGTARFVPINESHPLQAQSPYSATKIGADAMALSFFNTYNLPVVVARPFNTYGPRQSARAVIPTIISQIIAGQKKIQLGSLHPTRDFNYVHDTCEGLVALAECDKAIGESVNIGSGSEISIDGVANLIKNIISSDVEFTFDAQRERPLNSEVDRLVCDNTKLKLLTGFAPTFDLELGLKETIKWFSDKDNLKMYKTGIYNV